MKKVLKYEGKNIAYRLEGKGKPVMLVHGFGETSTVWDGQIDGLKDHCQLIVPDLPGSGESEMINDMSLEGMAEVLHEIIHEEGIDRCIVIGHSMGGYITLALAEKYWNHLFGFGLFHSSAFADSEEKKATRKKGIEFMQQHGAFEFLKSTSPNLFSPEIKEKNPELPARFIAGLSNFSTPPLVSYYEAMMQRPERTNLLKDSGLPVLFIMGKYDNAVPLEDGLKLCHMTEKAYIHIFQHSGHMGMLEEPDRSRDELRQFILEI